jgi:hypothetical protein
VAGVPVVFVLGQAGGAGGWNGAEQGVQRRGVLRADAESVRFNELQRREHELPSGADVCVGRARTPGFDIQEAI